MEILQLHASDAVPHTYEKTQFCASIDRGLAHTSMASKSSQWL
jgi:hypothetical protein